MVGNVPEGQFGALDKFEKTNIFNNVGLRKEI